MTPARSPRRCGSDPTLDITSQWANFVRNHDELTLDKLSDDERQEVFDAFGPDKDMQLYGRGLRRRLPSMLGGDERRMRMAYSLAFSLPGTPVLFYGEEIGMAENLDIPGRFAVRTPMQWTGGANGGFSKASKRRLSRPLPDGLYGPDRVNAADQRRDHDSFWWFMRNLIYTYRSAAGDRMVDRRGAQAAQLVRSWPTYAARSPAVASRLARRGRADVVHRQRRFVPEDVADHRRQDEAECGVDVRDVDRRRRAVPRVALVGHHDRGRLVGTEDRRLLGDVVGRAPARPAAHTRMSGSDDRSMCFLSSVASQAIDL